MKRHFAIPVALLVFLFVSSVFVAEAANSPIAPSQVVVPASIDAIDAAMAPAPALPAGWHNLFASLAAGQPVVAGTVLSDGCVVTEAPLLDGGWLKRTAASGTQPYIIGDHIKRVVVECAMLVTGTIHHGDQDPKLGELGAWWTLDDEVFIWTPAICSDCWQSQPFEGVRKFQIDFGGDSAAITIYVNPNTGVPPPPPPTVVETPVPSETLVPSETPVETEVPVETLTPTATSTPRDISTSEPPPTLTPTSVPATLVPTPTGTVGPETAIDPVGEIVGGIRWLYLPAASK